MTDIDIIVVRTLAASDAYRLPIRQWTRFMSANREYGLSLLGTHGVPLRVGGNEQTRKSGERTIAEAAEQGFIFVHRHGREKFSYPKLTPRGEAYARAITGLPGRDVGLLTLKAVAAKTDREPKTLDRLFLDEIALNDGRGWGDGYHRELSDVELRYLPAASFGWLVTNSTTPGHARYAVTAEGWAELDTPSPAPQVSKLPKPSPEAEELYFTARKNRLAEMSRSDPVQSGSIGALPLPVAHVGCPIGCYAPKRPKPASDAAPIGQEQNK